MAACAAERRRAQRNKGTAFRAPHLASPHLTTSSQRRPAARAPAGVFLQCWNALARGNWNGTGCRIAARVQSSRYEHRRSPPPKTPPTAPSRGTGRRAHVCTDCGNDPCACHPSSARKAGCVRPGGAAKGGEEHILREQRAGTRSHAAATIQNACRMGVDAAVKGSDSSPARAPAPRSVPALQRPPMPPACARRLGCRLTRADLGKERQDLRIWRDRGVDRFDPSRVSLKSTSA
eukprot:gene12314-biopygen14006